MEVQPGTQSLLPPNWKVPQQFRDRLGRRVGRQRLMEAEGHLLIILHEPPDADDDFRVGHFFWRSPEGAWKPKAQRRGELPIAELLAKYDQMIDKLDDREEIADSPDEYFSLLRDLNPLVRAANNFYNTLQKAREAMPNDRELLLLRDSAYAMSRRVELLAADTRHSLNYHIAMRAEEQTENSERMAVASYRLNLLVALFFPIATLAGVFGMNLHNPLEEFSEKAGAVVMVVVLLLGLLMGGILTFFVMQPPGVKKTKHKKLGDS
ncbi:CorA family divalent cation transporter [Aeoliella mucimassa]|uniref:CorA-like Mg2+ transporter protein n=1 Tax=Aeoliella mucimassa TaxID=2527972 RepID=A0A518AL74_9BACT|nr:CorA family divalent cation transporter [Aeoliella mucimassa]QDU55488.1 CorA-like Mg2+ transporter protein [Aeoliella mucimassa]